jgi:hypothetical protein
MQELKESREALINILNSTSADDFQNLENEEVKKFIEDFKDLTERMKQLGKK